MAGIFGTDGVRARINTGSMRAESVVRLALAAGRWFADKTADDGRMTRPMVVIGKDTRLSGYMLESALVAGFTSIGINCRAWPCANRGCFLSDPLTEGGFWSNDFCLTQPASR